jgi:excisionase family DNA binding protein
MAETTINRKPTFLKEFCELLDCNPKTARRYIQQGKISHVRIGNRIAFLPEHIEEYLRANTIPARPQQATTTGAKISDVVAEMKAKLLRSN